MLGIPRAPGRARRGAGRQSATRTTQKRWTKDTTRTHTRSGGILYGLNQRAHAQTIHQRRQKRFRQTVRTHARQQATSAASTGRISGRSTARSA
eukprot:932796-Prymnesium_polylepis.1